MRKKEREISEDYEGWLAGEGTRGSTRMSTRKCKEIQKDFPANFVANSTERARWMDIPSGRKRVF